jgi:hypothetical protein
MLSALLSDPMLQMLTPLDLIKVRQLCKDSRDVVEEYRKTQSSFVAEKESLSSWKARERLYSLYPAVRHLTVELGGWQSESMYLRPTIQSIHIVIPIELTHFEEYSEVYSRNYEEWRLRNIWDFVGTLSNLINFLEANPQAELHTVRISFHSTVKLVWEDAGRTCVGYDRGGPIYETFDVWVETNSSSPTDYLWLIESPNPDMEDAPYVLERLVGLRKWKLFEIPDVFPGADLCPTATLIKTNPYDSEDCDMLQNEVYDLFQQKLNKGCYEEEGNTNGF